MDYCAAIFDIIDSRKYNNRYDVQRVVRDSLEYLNYIFSERIKKKVVFGAGDEFQGLFRDPETAFLYARKLQLLIYPVKIRCGIGFGGIKYYEENWSSTEIDGEAYYNARRAIEEIPKKGSGVIFFNFDTRYDKYLNMYSLANTEIKNKQSQMVKLIELLADIAQPISYNTNFLKRENPQFYEKILRLKISLLLEQINLKYSKVYKFENKFIDIDNKLLYEMCYTNCQQIIDDNCLYIDCYWERGLSTLIAEIIGTTRQNIDKHISLGKVKESRNMDGTILMMLGERY